MLKPLGTGRRQCISRHIVKLYKLPASLANRLPMIAASEPPAHQMAAAFQLGRDPEPDVEVQIHGV